MTDPNSPVPNPDAAPSVATDAQGHPLETIAKRHLAERIAEKHDINQAVALAIIQTMLEEMAAELAKGNRLEFRDFGVFQTVVRKARTALNPKTLEKVPVKARTVVKFKPGRLLKSKVVNLNHPAPPAQP